MEINKCQTKLLNHCDTLFTAIRSDKRKLQDSNSVSNFLTQRSELRGKKTGLPVLGGDTRLRSEGRYQQPC